MRSHHVGGGGQLGPTWRLLSLSLIPTGEVGPVRLHLPDVSGRSDWSLVLALGALI